MNSPPKSATLIKPALTLLILSPITGELLSGSAPPSVFFTPTSLFILIGLYGCGALLVREYARRWGRGWACIILLGIAYGIIEEGLTAKSFFDPGWMDLGILGVYGRWLDVNWVWSQGLVIYHSLISITAPIILTQLAFPTHSAERWLGKRAFVGTHIWFLSVVVIGFLFITDFHPNIIQVAGCILAVGILAYFAKNHRPKALGNALRIAAPKRLYVLSVLMMVTFFPLLYWVGPYAVPNPSLLFIIGLFTCAAYVGAFRKWAGGNLSELHLLAIAGGIVSPWIVLAPIEEAFVSNPDGTAGMALVGAIYAVLIIVLAIRVRRRSKQSLSVPATTGSS